MLGCWCTFSRRRRTQRFGDLHRELSERRGGSVEAAHALLTLPLVDPSRLAADVGDTSARRRGGAAADGESGIGSEPGVPGAH